MYAAKTDFREVGVADWLLIGVLVTVSLAVIIAALRKLVGGNTNVNVTVNQPAPFTIPPELANLPPGSTVELQQTAQIKIQIGERAFSIASNTVISTDQGPALLLEPPAPPPDNHP